MRALVLSAALFAAAATADQVDHGRAVAVEACSACHKVTAAQPSPPPVADTDERAYVPAPSFASIARGKASDAALRRAITDPKHPMREQDWLPADLGAVVAYIRSLHSAKW